MAKRSISEKYDTEDVEVKEHSVSERYLMLNLSTIYTVVGKVTGRKYVWQGAGSILPVDPQDAEHFLSLFVQRGCCGSARINKPVFVEV